MKRINLFLMTFVLVSCDLVHSEVHLSSDSIKYIYDGDTITFKCRREFKCNKGSLKVRILGVDTPEIKGRCRKETILARKAKEFTVAFVRNANNMILTYDNSYKYDRYGRLLAYLSVDGKDLAHALIENKLGRSYDGGKRMSWC